MDKLFNSSDGRKMSIKRLVQEIKGYAEAAPNYQYAVVIGTDSELLGDSRGDFVTAVVVRRIGNGGRYFWRRENEGPFYTLRDRIIREVLISLEVAPLILEELKKLEHLRFQFEVHADIGGNGQTREMLSEVVGMIRAYNFEYRIKPESYAASSVADRYA